MILLIYNTTKLLGLNPRIDFIRKLSRFSSKLLVIFRVHKEHMVSTFYHCKLSRLSSLYECLLSASKVLFSVNHKDGLVKLGQYFSIETSMRFFHDFTAIMPRSIIHTRSS